MAQGLDLTIDYKKKATSEEPLTDKAHKDLVDQIRTFYLVGGMPAAVTEWIESHSYIEVSHVHTDIIQTYEDDFNKYKKRISPILLRQVLRSVALQVGNKFVYSLAARDVHSSVVKDALHLLTLAGLITPVKHTDGTGVPLGAEESNRYVKYLFFDLGVMLTMLDIPTADILTASDVDLVNKGGSSEMFAGLEMKKYRDCYQKPEMHYWQNTEKGSNAEVDYLRVRGGKVLPVEVKANTQGSMQSLWIFMGKRKLHEAIRTSLENFGQFDHYDPKNNFEQRHVDIVPLYALSNLQ
jgi:predicted AAA+ superfamily ATPase